MNTEPKKTKKILADDKRNIIDSFSSFEPPSEPSTSPWSLNYLSSVNCVLTGQCELLRSLSKNKTSFSMKKPDGDSENETISTESPSRAILSVKTKAEKTTPKLLGHKSVSFSEKVQLFRFENSPGKGLSEVKLMVPMLGVKPILKQPSQKKHVHWAKCLTT